MEKAYKGSPARLARYFEQSRDQWRQRSAQRQAEKRVLTYQVRDLRQSVSNWKARAQLAEASLKAAEAEVGELKKKLKSQNLE